MSSDNRELKREHTLAFASTTSSTTAATTTTEDKKGYSAWWDQVSRCYPLGEITHIVDSDDDELESLFRMADESESKKPAQAQKRSRKESPIARTLPLTSTQKLRALSGKQNFIFEHKEELCGTSIIVGGGTAQNKRDDNQDRLSVTRLSGVSNLTGAAIERIERHTVDALHDIVVPDAFNCGTTYTHVAIDVKRQRLVITNLGDGDVVAHYKKPDGTLHKLPLPIKKHNPTGSERTRITQAGHKVIGGDYPRLENTLAVSGAIGDVNAESCGLTHTPHVVILSYAHLIGQADWLQVTLRSDGAYISETLMDDDSFQQLLEANPGTARAQLQAKAMLQAVQQKCTPDNEMVDNFTVLTATIVLPTEPVELATQELGGGISPDTLSLLICDGHGGAKVADKCVREHPEQAQATITAYLRKHQPYLFMNSNADVDTNVLRISTESMSDHQQDNTVERRNSGLRKSADHSASSPRRNSQQFWHEMPPTQPYPDDDEPPSLSQPTPTTTLPLALSNGQSGSDDKDTHLKLNK